MSIKAMLIHYWWAVPIIAVAVIAVLSGLGQIQMNRMMANEHESLMADIDHPNHPSSPVIQEADLVSLPAPVQNWLNQTGVVGQKRIRSVTFQQSGLMKLSPDQKSWYESEARQTVRVDKPGYIWEVKLPMMPLVTARGRDLLLDGQAAMDIRIASLLPVASQSGNEKLNESALHRFLLE